MHGSTLSHTMSDALVILGAAGIVIPLFARFRITPVIGFILVGVLVGPYGLGRLVGVQPWLFYVTISDPEGLESLGLGDGHVEQPLVLPDQAAEAERADQQADEDEADHRGDAEAREDRDDDPRGAEYHQCVGHRVGEGSAMHYRTMAGAS